VALAERMRHRCSGAGGPAPGIHRWRVPFRFASL